MCHNAVLDEKIITDAAVEPVTLDEFKAWAKIDFTEDDLLVITPLIKTARRLLELQYNVGIIEKDYAVIVNNSCGMIDLPGAPIGSISTTGITMVGSFVKYPCNCNLSITYKSGYPLAGVPEEFKTAIKQQTIYMYENRGDVTTDPTAISPQAQATMQPYSRNTNGMFL